MALRRTTDRLSSGRRDRSITLQQRPAEDTADADSGEPIDGPWTNLVCNMPASRLSLSASERFRSEQVSARMDDEWEINYRADMDPELVDVPKCRRLKYQGRLFEITGADLIGRRRGIRIYTLSSSSRVSAWAA